MRWSSKVWPTAACGFVLASGLAYGQQQGAQTQQNQRSQVQVQQRTTVQQDAGQMTQAQYTGELRRAADLIGHKVVNAQGEELGEVHEIVIDASRGEVAYGVLSFGGFLGMGEKLFAVPWHAINVEGEGEDARLVLDVDRERLQQAQGFDRNNWPDFADQQLFQQTSQFYGVERDQGQVGQPQNQQQLQQLRQQHQSLQQQYQDVQRQHQQLMQRQQQGQQLSQQDQQRLQQYQTQLQQLQRQTQQLQQQIQQMQRRPGQAMNPQRGQQQFGQQQRLTQGPQLTQEPFWVNRLTRLTGLPVRNHQNQALGNIEDLIIDIDAGRVTYGVVSYGGTLGMGEKLVLVPWSALELRPQREMFVLDADQQTLDQLAFASDQWPNYQDEQYAIRVHSAFNQEPYWETFAYAGEQGAWAKDSRYNNLYKAGEAQTISGQVQSVGTFRPAMGAEEGMRLRIESEGGQMVTVHLGPESFLQEQGVALSRGDQVTIEGAPATFEGRSVLLAKKITLDDGRKTVELRNDQGDPQWIAGQQQQSMQPGQQRGQQQNLGQLQRQHQQIQQEIRQLQQRRDQLNQQEQQRLDQLQQQERQLQQQIQQFRQQQGQ